ncbi:hypothetical protein [Polluticoccus soli]|uniref:hypothetical protein n=1 Tax=Polluticoccus soli TaxID=3034150 RepID=UPI0023E2CB1F|nr:hypothetical protein [Flavipsychrobacter sp. JY13-12]
MKHVRLSLLIFSAYVAVMGSVLLFAPLAILPIFDLPTAGDVWIRLLGFVLLSSSVYYIGAARLGFTPFAWWTVYTRAFAPVLIVILIAMKLAPIQLISCGIVDGLGGLWTYWALKKAQDD